MIRFLTKLFTSCAAGTSILLTLLVLSGSLASTATTGRRAEPVMFGVLLALVDTTSTLMRQRFTRRGAQTAAGSVFPSAALVLY